MPKVKPVIQRSRISVKNTFISEVKYNPININIEEDPFLTRSLKTKNSYTSIIEEDSYNVKINQVLPFRVRFTNMGIEGFTVPPIGIAIIGYNNYIL